jgi:hypothetical protein
MPTVLLVNPWIHDFSAYDLWMKPLGLLYIGAYLEKDGYDIKLVDCLDRHHPALDSKSARNRSFGCGYLPYQFIPKPAIYKDIPRRYKRYGIPPEAFKDTLSKLAQNTQPALIVVTSMMTYWYPGGIP